MAPGTAIINQSKAEFSTFGLHRLDWLLPYPLTLENPVQVLQSFIDVIWVIVYTGVHAVAGSCTLAEARTAWKCATTGHGREVHGSMG